MATLKKIIEDKRKNISEVIKTISFFETWFNKNLAIVISFISDNTSRYEATLVIYKPAERWMEEILEFRCIASNSKLDRVEEEVEEFKRKLNENHPAIYFNFPETIVEIKLPYVINFNNPDYFIKPLDVIKIQRRGYKHVAIYLVNGKVCQVEGAEGKSAGLLNKMNSDGVRITDWQTFLSDNPGEVTRYHAVIPFKRIEKIIDHIEKALLGKYGKGEYNLLLKNCEHFANMCVYGINKSEQVEDWKSYLGTGGGNENSIFWEIKKNDKMFANLKTSRQLTMDEELIINELRRSVKVDDGWSLWSLWSLWSYGKSLTQQFFSAYS